MKVKHLTIYHACTANRKQWANVIFHCESLCPSINFEWQTERTVPPQHSTCIEVLQPLLLYKQEKQITMLQKL